MTVLDCNTHVHSVYVISDRRYFSTRLNQRRLLKAASVIFWYTLHYEARSTDLTRGLLLHCGHARSFVWLIYSLPPISFLPFLFLRLHPRFIFLILLFNTFPFSGSTACFFTLHFVLRLFSCSCLPIFIPSSSSSSQFINLFCSSTCLLILRFFTPFFHFSSYVSSYSSLPLSSSPSQSCAIIN